MGTSGEAQNIDFSKILGMALPGVEYIPMSLETIFKLSRAPQRPYIEKSGKVNSLYILLKVLLFSPIRPGLGLSYLAKCAAPYSCLVLAASLHSFTEGCITMEEFERRLQDERVMAYFNAMKLDVSDARALAQGCSGINGVMFPDKI